MRVTIKYSMAVEEGMRRFFFSLLSSLCLRQPPRDPEPGGLAAGRAQRRRRRRARTQPGPGPPRARHSLPTPAAALRSAPLRAHPASAGAARTRTHTHTHRDTHAHSRRGAGTQPAARARCGGGCVLRGSATCSPALRPTCRRAPPPPVALRSRRSRRPLPRRCGIGTRRRGGCAERSGAGGCPASAAAPIQRRAPRCARSGYPSCRSGGRAGGSGSGGGCARGVPCVCARTGVAPPPSSPCARGCSPTRPL